MAKRKRTEEEQHLFDELEVLRTQRREMSTAVSVARDAFEATSMEEATQPGIIMSRGGNVLAAIALLRNYDAQIAEKKAIYDALRKKNDSPA